MCAFLSVHVSAWIISMVNGMWGTVNLLQEVKINTPMVRSPISVPSGIKYTLHNVTQQGDLDSCCHCKHSPTVNKSRRTNFPDSAVSGKNSRSEADICTPAVHDSASVEYCGRHCNVLPSLGG